jgi:site-specific DNA-cytosine methylase
MSALSSAESAGWITGSPELGFDTPSSVRRTLGDATCSERGSPDGWTLPGPDSRRYAGLGDAVTASVAEWIGARILEADRV